MTTSDTPRNAPIRLLDKDVFEAREAQEILRLSKNSVNQLLLSGRLYAIRYGRKWLIPRESLLKFLAGEC